MKKLDDIRNPNQPVQPQPQPQTKRSRGLQKIWQRTKTVHVYKPRSFFRFPRRLIKHTKIIFIFIILVFFIGAAATLLIKTKKIEKTENSEQEISEAEQLKQVVIKEDTKLVIDFTFNLKMIINNQPQAIPAGYGRTEDERFIFNTDTSSGDIHVQSPKKEAYTLHDFFVLWGGQFNSSCLLNHCLSSSGSLTMTVNGNTNSDLSDYVIKPDDQIVITYND